jgi:hypothetical protein
MAFRDQAAVPVNAADTAHVRVAGIGDARAIQKLAVYTRVDEFLRLCADAGYLPHVPNAETQAAIHEKPGKRFSLPKAFLAGLK